jgi:hypothetical protein
MNFRENGKNALSTCLTIPKNVDIIESIIYNKSGEDLYKYNELIFQCVDSITNGYKLSELVGDIKEDMIGLKTNDEQQVLDCNRQDVYGVSCSKCESKRSITYAKKPNNIVMATCIKCKNKWVHSG